MSSAGTEEKAGLTAPLKRPVFRALWVATIFSNMGTLIQGVAGAWLMTSLSTSPLMVGLIQTAMTLPVFLFGPLSGALADLVERRRILIVTQSWMFLVAVGLSVATLSGLITPWLLLAFIFCMGIGNAFNMPAWQANVQDIVPRREVSSAVSLNSISFNTARSTGPAVGGLLVAAAGPGVAFVVNALSYSGVLSVLFWWKPERPPVKNTEDVFGALQAGLRYALHATAIHPPLIRGAAFVLCSTAILALMPILARERMGLTAVGFGLLLAAFGVGSIAGASMLPRLRQRFRLDQVTLTATLGMAVSLLVIGFSRHPVLVGPAMLFAGGCWVVVVIISNVTVQTSVPNWVRGRVMAMLLLAGQGSIAIGSAIWGAVADRFGETTAFEVAAGLILLTVLLIRRLPLPEEELDLRPISQWHETSAPPGVEAADGPVLVLVDYRIEEERSEDFRAAMRDMRRLRLRDGASRWRLCRDTLQVGRYVEIFRVNSWGEYLRQQSRMTMADKAIKAAAHRFHAGPEPPEVQHFLNVDV